MYLSLKPIHISTQDQYCSELTTEEHNFLVVWNFKPKKNFPICILNSTCRILATQSHTPWIYISLVNFHTLLRMQLLQEFYQEIGKGYFAECAQSNLFR